MGSPLGPILANVFLCHFLKKWLSDCPPEFLHKIFKRFVDNIFVMFLCKTQLNEFVFYENTKHCNIKFTSEFQEDDTFFFWILKSYVRTIDRLLPFFVKLHLEV